MITTNPKRYFRLFLKDWYCRGFKFFRGEEPGLPFNCWNSKRVWFLLYRCEDTGYYDYRPTDFYSAVIERDFSYKNFVCDIASSKQIETLGFYIMNKNSIISFTKRYNKNKDTLYCSKYDREFVCQAEYKFNPSELPPMIINDDYLSVKKKYTGYRVFYIRVLLINKLTDIFTAFHSHGTEIYIIQVGKSVFN